MSPQWMDTGAAAAVTLHEIYDGQEAYPPFRVGAIWSVHGSMAKMTSRLATRWQEHVARRAGQAGQPDRPAAAVGLAAAAGRGRGGNRRRTA